MGTSKSCRYAVRSLCAVVALVLMVVGYRKWKAAGSDGEALAKADQEQEFVYLGKVCNISAVQHSYATKRESRTKKQLCGGKECATKDVVDFCLDTVSYKFKFAESDLMTEYSGKDHVTRRNEDITVADGITDMCKGAMGYVADPVCKTRICAVNDQVDCWRPVLDCGTDCQLEYPWANCGNNKCMKLTDPATDYQVAKLMAMIKQGKSTFMFFTGAWLCCCIGFSFCNKLCCRHGDDVRTRGLKDDESSEAESEELE